jgi:hypothetical protein
MPRTAKPFFIPMVYSPSGAVGHVATPELPLRKAEPGAVRDVATPELTSSRRQSSELWDTWQHQSSHLRKVESGAIEHVALELTSSKRCGSKLYLT